MESFEAGDSVILTLKDQGILEEDEHGRATGLAEEEDELENVNMKEAEVRVPRVQECRGRCCFFCWRRAFTCLVAA